MYSVEFKKIANLISQRKARLVLLQLPDGLKPRAAEIISRLKSGSPNTEFVVWGGSCFGACDIPLHTESLGFDLLVHFGHTEFVR